LGDAWTAEATFSKLPETKWQGHYFMFRFSFIAEMFSALSVIFLFGRAFFCARFVVPYLAVYSILESLTKQT